MCRGEPIEQPVRAALGPRPHPRQTPMDVAVVDDRVQRAVCGHAHADRDQWRQGVDVEPGCEPDHHDRREADRVPVVRLEGSGARPVMAAMEPLTDAVHHEAVHECGDGFHHRHRDGGDHDEGHHAATLSVGHVIGRARVGGSVSASRTVSVGYRTGCCGLVRRRTYDVADEGAVCATRRRVCGEGPTVTVRARRSNRRRTVIAVTGLVVTMTACGAADEVSQQQLPPIITTTSTTTTTTTVPQDRFYTVQRGDILAVIAATYGVTIESIVEMNQLDNPDDIQAGQVLEIPPNVRVAGSDDSDASETPVDDADAGGDESSATDPP